MKRFALLTLFPLLVVAAPTELPKELRVAEEMMKDGLGRDAATRIQDWLQRITPPPASGSSDACGGSATGSPTR